MEGSPVPVPDDPDPDADECRLWVGNLDKRVTEFSMLKLVQRFGELRKFDFLYNKTGLDIGKPRGYCFVSYLNRKDAEKALQSLNGKLALSKKLLVRWAHQEKTKNLAEVKTSENVESSCQSVDMKIQAIESKLRQMEKTQKEFTLSTDIQAAPGSSKLSKENPENIRTQIQNKPKPYYKKPRR